MRISLALLLCFGMAACSTLSPSKPPPVYVVFFEGPSVTLSDTAKAIVDHAAAEAKSSGAMVQVAGQSTKSKGYNPAMAEPRIHAVEDAFIAGGITADRLVRTSFTTGDAKVDASGAQRVEIRLMDKPDTATPAAQ